MIEKSINTRFIINGVPLIGIICFLGLYTYSTTLYPGGSQANLNSEGFDWINNYWCNLMDEKGMNGEANPARLFSILAMVVVCISLMVFFIRFFKTYSENRLWKRIFMVSGVLSMTFATLIFSEYHDLMIILSSIFGLVVVIGIIREVYKSKLKVYKISGVICVLLLGMNNYIYYTQKFIETLPLLQKITIVIVLIWVMGLNYELTKKNEKLTTIE